MEKLKLHSPDFTQENIAKLAELFPNCITEATDEKGSIKRSIDFDQLRQELSSSIVEGSQERYQLNWPGKREALLTANAPIAKTLRPCREESVAFDTTKNLFIEGDNLDALKLLQETYLNKVKMIYIDPPYNTGNDFIYEDDFAEDAETYFERSNQKDEIGNRMVANTEANGRFHSDWLSMMYPRLKLARNLLRDEGVIFISIDDNEQANLKRLCDEIFGDENYVNTISINSKVSAGASGGGEDKKLKKNIEYLHMYAKNIEQLPPVNPPYKESLLFDYIAQMKKDGKSFKYTNILYKKENLKFFKTIKDGSGDDIDIHEVCDFEIKTVKQVSQLESISEEAVFIKYYDQIMTTTNAQTSIRDRVWAATGNGNQLFTATYKPKSGKNKGNSIELLFYGKQKVLLIWLKDTSIIKNNNIFKREKIGTYWDGFSWINVSKEGDTKFDNGKKPISMIQRMVSLYSSSPDAVILDFFSGSSTTAHAVLELNAEDGGQRKFIMVQLHERCDDKSEAFKDGYKSIAEIGKERIRRAGKKIKSESALTAPDLDIGFRVLKIDSSNMSDVYYSPDEVKQGDLPGQINNIREGRNEEDLLFQVLLDWGVDLSLPITREVIAGKNVFFVDGNALAACFEVGIDESFVKLLAAKHPLRAVFFDASFSSDSVKINIEQIFKLISPTTEIKTI